MKRNATKRNAIPETIPYPWCTASGVRGFGVKANPKYKPRFRNPSKNTIKKLMRPANYQAPGWGMCHQDYHLFNLVGARVYIMSKGKICNRAGTGSERYFNVSS